ncbi:MAG: polysaccharide pyruvyl transferase family protein [Herbinix sp.]|nr:polysaccharide pyruvyl transferase family protein [Herbinix sp.]
MKKRVGMTSFHESTSFGGTLQCVALQHVIKGMGYEAEFIDFRRNECIALHSNKKNTIKQNMIAFSQALDNALHKQDKIIVRDLFNEFKAKTISIGTTLYSDIDALYGKPPIYDVYLTGSDQVWNPYSSFLKVYGLGFAETNKIAYAASIGVSEIPDSKKQYMTDNISGFEAISCREIEGCNALEQLLNRPVINVLDPTLLIDKQEWSKISTAGSVVKEKYLLCFFLGSLSYSRQIAKKIAREHNLRIVMIPGSPKDMLRFGYLVKGCGPSEFLNLFMNADFICTDSFHGTAFSINMNKPFYSFCRRGYNERTSYISRIVDLLQLLGIEDRLVYPDSNIDNNILPIDYESINKALDEERKKSRDFLRRALDGES